MNFISIVARSNAGVEIQKLRHTFPLIRKEIVTLDSRVSNFRNKKFH